jgi:hypothetical protein
MEIISISVKLLLLLLLPQWLASERLMHFVAINVKKNRLQCKHWGGFHKGAALWAAP